jgi:hypothetical protein
MAQSTSPCGGEFAPVTGVNLALGRKRILKRNPGQRQSWE